YAALGGHAAVAEALLQGSKAPAVDVRAADVLGFTPLHYAAMGNGPGARPVIALLLKRGADPTARAREPLIQVGQAPRHLAAERGQLAAVAALLDARKDLVNLRNNFGETPLHLAARGNHLDLAQLLLERGADPRARTNDRAPLPNRTPVDYADALGHS